MAYTKNYWYDNVTPLDAEHMNNIEDGIQENSDAIDSVTVDLTDIQESVDKAQESADAAQEAAEAAQSTADSAADKNTEQDTSITANATDISALQTENAELKAQIAEMEAEISELNSDLSDLIVVERITTPYSIDGNASIDISAEKEGYTLLAVVGINGFANAVNLRGFIANPSQTADVRLYVNCSSTASGNINVDCLFFKNL